MHDLLTPADIERLAKAAGLPMSEVCRRARCAQSTWSRWRGGKTEPTLDIYRRLRDAVLPPAPPDATAAPGPAPAASARVPEPAA